jgi:prepilin-type N-terminal cleavage/methylation domain-containing protein
MLRRLRNQKGFTLIELLIVIAIIGIIAALLIPNFLDSLNKARQKNTMASLRNVGTAMMARITDEGAAAAAGQSATTVDTSDFTGTPIFVGASSLSAILVPQYIQAVPLRDSWKQTITWMLTLDPTSPRQALAASCGKDGDCTNPWTIGTFFATDYNQDLVWNDGQFSRYPSGTSQQAVN